MFAVQKRWFRGLAACCCAWVLAVLVSWPAGVRAAVPGAGVKVPGAGDDFEDEDWKFIHHFPKSSKEQDERVRRPTGRSVNGRWFEGLKRGQPDVVRRVDTPPGGLAGSAGALFLVSRKSGIPGQLSGKSQQDDLIMNGRSKWGSRYPVSLSPSAVVRVCLPPVEEWENRRGSVFAFRTSVMGMRRTPKRKSGLFGGFETPKSEESWPGIFVQYDGKTSSGEPGAAYLLIRGRESGDYRGPKFEESGWWTFGISFTPDGRAHYYAHPGVEDLGPEDHIASHYPYNFRVQSLATMFFDTFNRDNGRSWSTPIVIDDPAIYAVRRPTTLARKRSSGRRRR